MHWLGVPRGIAAKLETRRFHEWPLEDTATLNLDLTSASGHIYLTWAADERSNQIEIKGEQGDISVVGDCIIVRSDSGTRRLSCPPSLSEGSHHPDWFVGVIEDFRIATTSHAKGNLDEAVLCAQLINLAQRSSAADGARLPIGT
jgi:predicted dehydrogenase